MEKKAGEDEIVEEERGTPASIASASKKRKREAADGAPGAGVCDDVLGCILARLPARTAVACTALSKRHRRLILSPEFRSLHCRLAPPLPRPHVAYIATAPLRWTRERDLVSEFNGFHVAVAGAGISGSAAPMRALFGERYFEDRSNTYKLLLCRKDWQRFEYSLHVYALGGQPRLRAVSSTGLDTEIHSQESLYMDGTVFVLDVDKKVILAFDVDDETVTTINLPGKRVRGWARHARSTLMEMDGRLCLATNLGHHHRVGLWLLTADRRWERRCAIELKSDVYHRDDKGNLYDCSIAGAWDCGGVLALYIQGLTASNNRLCLYHLSTEQMFDAKMPRDLAPECSKYAVCWGYRPTLVAPRSIVELSRDEERRRSNAADIMEALKPINDKDSREGRKDALGTVCFKEFLVSTMRKLPDGLHDVIKLPLLEPKDSDLVSENESEDSENAARDAFEILSGSDRDSDW
ncbi:uncharacterized protein C2845_PM15G20240 [Panicum miliaceum]|uniref:F-box associated beta-propeller type 3 domain-containing protein n=1 Tax=Panicum miliaceum TaxID=4540 RepID=A0A3L6QB30_PANMI|nr:uncharacterized protein C2845_PM15G20240 [Panicum miliaceum]